ncbi:MAG: sulfatase-like hydrolase/transferase [Bacteroidales bacterium]|nr:sulfatase-like hydrolase/transferase [Bacteroidales bacterium]
MKRFNRLFSHLLSPDVLLWLYPITLIIPNVALDITEYSHALVKITNILLPAGLYMLLTGLSRNVGRTVLCCLPLAIFAAFQIVLLFLYGESIIAVDMFLNVVTTNISEASELLGNLAMAIVIVLLIYLLPLIWGIVLMCKSSKADAADVKTIRRTGIVTAMLGIAMLSVTYCAVPRFNILRDIFPVNVIHNMITAIQRTEATNRYFETSAGFDYKARSCRDNRLKEIYVLVVGETSRADNWQLNGYQRPTNPRLSHTDNLIYFPKTLSESNTTHKSVPLMLSSVSAETFADSIYTTKGIISAFNQAGYRTAWLTNQARNHSFIDFFAREAQVVDYINDDGRHHFDHELIKPLHEFIENSPSDKMFVVMHTYGSHFNYNERYPADRRRFTPDGASSASVENRPQLVNAYDNTIVYTDSLLADIINVLDSADCVAGLIYMSDHGEDIFDDRRERFLHASPVPTYYQIHVPMLLWMSPELREAYPDLYNTAESHRNLNVSSSRTAFDTMLSMAGVTTRMSDASKALTERDYVEGRRLYLNDHNEAVPLKGAGLRDYDYTKLDKNRINY